MLENSPTPRQQNPLPSYPFWLQKYPAGQEFFSLHSARIHVPGERRGSPEGHELGMPKRFIVKRFKCVLLIGQVQRLGIKWRGKVMKQEMRCVFLAIPQDLVLCSPSFVVHFDTSAVPFRTEHTMHARISRCYNLS